MEINEQKQKAIECLKTLDIYKPYVEAFRRSGRVCFFEGFGGYYVDQEPEIEAKMKEVNEKYGLVYAITHEFLEFGECYSFLYISKYKEDWKYAVEDVGENKFIVSVYVWNKDCDWCSELGSIVVKSFGGGIKRIA